MHIVVLVLSVGWVVFWAGWLIAAFTAKASTGGWRRFTVVRIVLVVIAVALVHALGRPGLHAAAPSPWAAGIGLAVWVAGLGLAVWARLYIGRNWGMPMTRRKEPDLVTTGPYRFVRHPIYTGIIVAVVGTALATSLYLLIAAAVAAGYFVFSASREERFLGAQFPMAYPGYRARTKMLVPFVF